MASFRSGATTPVSSGKTTEHDWVATFETSPKALEQPNSLLIVLTIFRLNEKDFESLRKPSSVEYSTSVGTKPYLRIYRDLETCAQSDQPTDNTMDLNGMNPTPDEEVASLRYSYPHEDDTMVMKKMTTASYDLKSRVRDAKLTQLQGTLDTVRTL
ncbi:MAG: hypothetical protein LQ343_001130 [Gyalolechia ehrenbergii]|nr:MAG: hypothetical protein LQ343_001130 [Gyalolechia ehrenbergii]